MLRKVQEDSGAFDLRFLAGMTKEDADRYLQSLPGVGPKTSSVVLLFSFGFAALLRLCRPATALPPYGFAAVLVSLARRTSAPSSFLSTEAICAGSFSAAELVAQCWSEIRQCAIASFRFPCRK